MQRHLHSVDFAGWDSRIRAPSRVGVTAEALQRVLGELLGETETLPIFRSGEGQRWDDDPNLNFRANPTLRRSVWRALKMPEEPVGAGQPIRRVLDRPKYPSVIETFRGEQPQRELAAARTNLQGGVQDLGDPQIGKWALVVLEQDARAAREALGSLLSHRIEQQVAFDGGAAAGGTPGMICIRRPVSDNPQRWLERLEDATAGNIPFYLLLIGGPDRFPFEVQYYLDFEHATGRLDVSGDLPEAWDSCRIYCEKLLRFEHGLLPVQPKALFYSFATDSAMQAVRENVVDKLATACASSSFQHLPTVSPLHPDMMLDHAATTPALIRQLTRERPGLVFTTSHGLEFPATADLWGALTDSSFVGSRGETPLSAAMIPSEPFAPGAVVFSFACFSAGVPQKSVHRLLFEQEESDLVPAPFISALPKRLIAHPNGPVAFIGHVDRVTTSLFSWRRHGVVPFLPFLEWSLGGFGTLGQAMYHLRLLVALALRDLGRLLSPLSGRQSNPQSEAVHNALLRRHDAEGYLLIGDPALRLSDGFV